MSIETVLAVQTASAVLAWIGGAACLVATLTLGWAVLVFGSLWFQGYMSGARISLLALIGMRLRQVDAQLIMRAKIMARHASIGDDPASGLSTRRLEAHYLAGGNVTGVIKAIIAAHRADIDLEFDRAAAIDLAGRDVLDAVQTSVYPKVIDCPNPSLNKNATLSGVAKNGVELKVRARVTVRTNSRQLIGGATEETVVARVGEGIFSSIGAARDHMVVMGNPDRISSAVLARGLDAQTAFEIVSIDIADIEVGSNIGARLQVDQAEADTRMARANAEVRLAQAAATFQERKAKIAENRARVIAAEALIPAAIAAAFRRGPVRRRGKSLPAVSAGRLAMLD